MKNLLLILSIFFAALFASAQAPTDIFFSEYVEGSGNNKALEIYNPTPNPIDLNNYYVARYSNGNPTYGEGGLTHLTGTLEPYHTFVLVNGQTTSTSSSPACSLILQAMADQLDGEYPAPTYMNGNDAISLFKTPDGATPNGSNETGVDLIGQIGLGAFIVSETGWSYVKDSTLTYNNSTGTPVTGKVINYIVQAKATDGIAFGPFWMSWTSDHSLIRKPNVTKGLTENPVPFKVSVEWDTVPAKLDSLGHWVYKDIWDNLGSHNCIANGINDIPVRTSVDIYPNPVNTDKITIKSRVPVKKAEIFTIIGQSVYNESYATPLKETEINTSKLVNGIYIVKVTFTNNSSAVQRILVK